MAWKYYKNGELQAESDDIPETMEDAIIELREQGHDVSDCVLEPSDKYELMDTGEQLTKEEYEELQKLADEMASLSSEIVEDYKLNPSEMSGSVVQVNYDSPFLDDKFKGEGWKKVIRGSVEEAISMIKNKDKNDTK